MDDEARECGEEGSAIPAPDAAQSGFRRQTTSTGERGRGHLTATVGCSSRYRGAPDPLRGEAPSQEVRTEADVCLKAIFGNDSAAQQNPCAAGGPWEEDLKAVC